MLVNRHTSPITPSAVVPDDYAGACAAVEYLLGLGHRRIAHISGSDEVSTGYLRRQGYLETLRRHETQASVDPALLVSGSFRESGGYEAMRILLELSDPPTAVFVVNDLAALGALHAIADVGLRVPDDISVVGFNGVFQATYVTPLLTTMQVPHRDMGARAVERLLAIIIDGVWPERPLLLPVALVERASSGPPRSRERRDVGPHHSRERGAAESGR